MAAPLSTCTVEEQRSVIRFLWSEGVKPSEIYRRMKVQYGDSCLSQGRVYEWVERFRNDDDDDAGDDDVVEAVQNWLKATPKSFFLEGIRKLVDRWTKCVAKQGDYVEK
jgi:hypothetical protein